MAKPKRPIGARHKARGDLVTTFQATMNLQLNKRPPDGSEALAWFQERVSESRTKDWDSFQIPAANDKELREELDAKIARDCEDALRMDFTRLPKGLPDVDAFFGPWQPGNWTPNSTGSGGLTDVEIHGKGQWKFNRSYRILVNCSVQPDPTTIGAPQRNLKAKTHGKPR